METLAGGTQKVSEIREDKVVWGFVSDDKELVLDTVLNREPVEVIKDRMMWLLG